MSQVRQKVVEYITAHKDQFCFYFDGDREFDKYIAQMRKNKVCQHRTFYRRGQKVS